MIDNEDVYTPNQAICALGLFLISALVNIYALALFLTDVISGYNFLITILIVGCIFHIGITLIGKYEQALFKCIAYVWIFIAMIFIVKAIWVFDINSVLSFLYGIAAILEFCFGCAILCLTSD